jgi:hypothetical protein
MAFRGPSVRLPHHRHTKRTTRQTLGAEIGHELATPAALLVGAVADAATLTPRYWFLAALLTCTAATRHPQQSAV